MKRFLNSLSIALCVALIGSAGFLVLSATNAHAQETTQTDPHIQKASGLITSMGEKAHNIISNRLELGQPEARKQFRALVNDNFDLKTIARFTLGRYWRAATEEQRKTFTQLIQDVILNKYADRILNYNGEKFTVTGARGVSDTDAVVNMNVKPEGNPAVVFSWRVRQFDDKMKVIDLSIEGVSMSVTHRNDFSAIIQRNGGSVQSLIEKLQEKAAE